MAETQEASVTTTAPATGGESAPAVATTEIVPATTQTETPSSPAASATETKPAAEAPVTEVKTETKTDAPIPPVENILGDDKPKPETKVEEKKIEAKAEDGKDAKPSATETKPAESEKPVSPVYEFKLPENVQFDKEPLENFNKLLGEIETGKLDHDTLQAKGQTLVDMHVKAVTDTLQRQTDYYVNLHKETGNKWLEAFKKDPDLGGDNRPQTVSELQHAVASYAGNEAQVKEFREIMQSTNVGNHPALIRFVKNMADKIAKYESEPANGMVPAAKPAPMKVKPYEVFYSGGTK